MTHYSFTIRLDDVKTFILPDMDKGDIVEWTYGKETTPIVINGKPQKVGRRCLDCKNPLTNLKYKYCYRCFTKRQKICEDCDKVIYSEDYDKCYDCYMDSRW